MLFCSVCYVLAFFILLNLMIQFFANFMCAHRLLFSSIYNNVIYDIKSSYYVQLSSFHFCLTTVYGAATPKRRYLANAYHTRVGQ